MAEEKPAEKTEKIENLPGLETPKKGSGFIIPLIVVIVLVPLLSFLSTNFFLVPKIKHAISQAVQEASNAKLDEHASSPPITSPEASAEAPKGKKAAAEHGAAPAKAPAGTTYEFQDIVANLTGALHSRYIKVSFTVEGKDPDFVHKVEASKSKLIDATIGVLSALSVADLDGSGVKNVVKNNLLTAFELALNSDLIEKLYFSEFLIQ